MPQVLQGEMFQFSKHQFLRELVGLMMIAMMENGGNVGQLVQMDELQRCETVCIVEQECTERVIGESVGECNVNVRETTPLGIIVIMMMLHGECWCLGMMLVLLVLHDVDV